MSDRWEPTCPPVSPGQMHVNEVKFSGVIVRLNHGSNPDSAGGHRPYCTLRVKSVGDKLGQILDDDPEPDGTRRYKAEFTRHGQETYMTATTFGDLARYMVANAEVGMRVYLEGHLESSRFTNKDTGKKQYSVILRARRGFLLGHTMLHPDGRRVFMDVDEFDRIVGLLEQHVPDFALNKGLKKQRELIARLARKDDA